MDYYSCKWVRPIFKHDAVTLFGNTYYSVPQSVVSDRLRRHEDCHKRQQFEEPVLFYLKYLLFNITRGYNNNPYEVTAKLAELNG